MGLQDKNTNLGYNTSKPKKYSPTPSISTGQGVTSFGPKNTVKYSKGGISSSSIMSYQAPVEIIPGGPIPPGPMFSNAYSSAFNI